MSESKKMTVDINKGQYLIDYTLIRKKEKIKFNSCPTNIIFKKANNIIEDKNKIN